MRYDQFLEDVDNTLMEKFGFFHDDLPDFTWEKCWESGDSPDDAVEAYIESGFAPKT